MSFQPSPLQVLVLWKMLFLGEEYSFSKSKPTLQAPARRELEQAGLVEVIKKGRSSYLVLTDKAWDWAAEHLDAPVSDRSPQAGPILQGVLAQLKTFLQRENHSLIDLLRPEETTPQPIDIHRSSPSVSTEGTVGESRIRAAYLQASEGRFREQVRLAHLRKFLADLPESTVNDALRRLHREEKIILYPLDDPQAISPEDEAAALSISDRDKHLIILEG